MNPNDSLKKPQSASEAYKELTRNAALVADYTPGELQRILEYVRNENRRAWELAMVFVGNNPGYIYPVEVETFEHKVEHFLPHSYYDSQRVINLIESLAEHEQIPSPQSDHCESDLTEEALVLKTREAAMLYYFLDKGPEDQKKPTLSSHPDQIENVINYLRKYYRISLKEETKGRRIYNDFKAFEKFMDTFSNVRDDPKIVLKKEYGSNTKLENLKERLRKIEPYISPKMRRKYENLLDHAKDLLL